MSSSALQIVAVALLWGCTNPLLNRAAQQKHHTVQHATLLKQLYNDIYSLVANYRFLLCYLLNQCGSVLFLYLLGNTPLSLASPLCNGLTFVTTALMSYYIGEHVNINMYTVAGCTLIVTGFAICIQQQHGIQ